MAYTGALSANRANTEGRIRLHARFPSRYLSTPRNLVVYLPPGYQEWQMLAGRVGPMCAWMHTLSLLEDVEVPPVPPDVDDGLGDGAGPR